MRLLRAATFFVCCASLAFAQDQAENLCGSASVTTVDHDGGVTVQKVTLSRKWGGNEAIAYLPDKKIEMARLCSHIPRSTRTTGLRSICWWLR
jgi:hypothetical protein